MLPYSSSTSALSSKTPSLSSFSTSSSSTTSSDNGSSIASRRGQHAVSLLPTYLADARAVQTYDKDTAPNGALQLGVAESQLVEDLLVPKLNQWAREIPFTADGIYYQPTPGRPGMKLGMAEYMKDLLQLPVLPDTDGIIVGAGCNAVLENLCFALAEPGDTCLIPTPYYAAFEFDLVARAGLNIVPVTTMDYANCDSTDTTSTSSVDEAMYYPTPAALDAAFAKATTPPKVLLLSHPHNPLGICYPPHVIQDCIDWCRSNRVHLISDEIYAGSVYRPEDANFVSALQLASSGGTDDNDDGPLGLGPYIHWVYALSKDFALSGMRVGVAYSENPEIRMPLQKMNDMCQISSHTQMLVQEMMTADADSGEDNKKWTTVFRQAHHDRLRARGDTWQSLLQELEIPHLPAVSGLFCWMDLSEFLEAGDDTEEERERALYLTMVNDFGLLFTPGLSMRNERPGFFRCVFSAATEDEYKLALTRFRTFVQQQRGV
ncbi:Probable inactive 1-aminocyclopropane-1-carboxylate synthase-like protein 2 [Seminavis robusta]|uniref:Probable inactive 1-aminocyclopropane-1-carboxylate synthase-like protein 2 n=1 Tax=Seminavis robusta TaxID=568900 RepID=A0A9N8H993_9STRA|nr:Probable inactive 1-aminocyclopropane-1-carboxylate synthase-like protein 2 [Seminavis robusta]|eukprot:Sro111_g055210.1 Probable inactive 1-aminocyclopropane-1-carboxylate synthase-like protein 2 (490) ;mRNA; r:36713-38182